MRPRLRPVVEAEHGFDDALQLIGELDAADPAAIGALRQFEALQVDAEGGVELGDRAREHDGAPRRILLHDRQAVRAGEFPDGGEIGGGGAELPGEILALEMAGPSVRRQLADPVLQGVAGLAPDDDADLQSLRGIGLADRLRVSQRGSLTAFQLLSCHGSVLLLKRRRVRFALPGSGE